MIPLLLEGLESALLPCSLILLIPGAAAALAARQESRSALVGFATGSIGFAWLRFSDRGGDLSTGVVALLLAAAVVLLAIPVIRRLNVVTGAGGLLAGVAAGVLWEPCVSTEFGHLLADLPTAGASGLGLLVIYMSGVLAPLLVVGAVMHLVPRPALIIARPVMLVLGGGVLAVLAMSTAAGFTDNLIGQLVEWSIT